MASARSSWSATNPYRLAQEIRGIGFASADQLAERLGIARDSPFRLRAGAAPRARGGAGPRPLRAAAARAARARGGRAARRRARRRSRRRSRPTSRAGALIEDTVEGAPCLFLPQDPPRGARDRGEPAPPRRAAARPGRSAMPTRGSRRSSRRSALRARRAASAKRSRMALTTKLLVITGGPGTGKTTLVEAILDGPRRQAVEVQLAAPTGRAARRLGESTGRDAKTLHRLLEAEPGRGFRRGAERPLELRPAGGRRDVDGGRAADAGDARRAARRRPR